MCIEKELERKIDKLVELIPLDNRHPLERAMVGPLWKKIELGHECAEIIKNNSEYQIFDNHLQYLGSSGSAVSYENLLDWILERGRQVGAKQAIIDLDRYISSSEVSVEIVELTNSLGDISFQFSNGVKYIDMNTIYKNENSIRSSSFRESLVNRPLWVPEFTTINGLFTLEFIQPITHIPSDEIERKYDVEIPIEKIKFTRLILSLARPIRYGVFGTGSTVVAPDNLPFIRSGQAWNITPSKPPSFGTSILEVEFKGANQLLTKFESLEQKFKDKLIIPLEKLNNFGSREPMVERAIELRTCLESIFLDDSEYEQIGFRLRLRSALFLGENIEEKKAIIDTIKKFYNLSSKAVHRGKFSANFKTDVLYEAANYARKALIKLINEGDVVWENLELE